MSDEKQMTIEGAHKYFAVQCFNDCWNFLERTDLSEDEKLEMLHTTHASAYHWLKRPDAKPENRNRALWQLSRAYVVAGEAGAARYYAQLGLDHCLRYGIGDWDLAFAYESLARAAAFAGDADARAEYVAKANAVEIKEQGDREIWAKDMATIPEVAPGV